LAYLTDFSENTEPQQPIRNSGGNSGESLLHKLEKSLHVTEPAKPANKEAEPLLQKLARSVNTNSPANGHVALETEIDKKALASAIISVFKTYPKLLQ
jgi:hypothetical protein